MKKIMFNFINKYKNNRGKSYDMALTKKLMNTVNGEIKRRRDYRHNNLIVSACVTTEGMWIVLSVKIDGEFYVHKYTKIPDDFMPSMAYVILNNNIELEIHDILRGREIIKI